MWWLEVKGGKGRRGEEGNGNGDRDKGGREARPRGQSRIKFETPVWQKMDTFARLGNTPFSLLHHHGQSTRVCIRLISNHFLRIRRAMISIQSPLAS